MNSSDVTSTILTSQKVGGGIKHVDIEWTDLCFSVQLNKNENK